MASHGWFANFSADFLAAGSKANIASRKSIKSGTSVSDISAGRRRPAVLPSIRDNRVAGDNLGIRSRFPIIYQHFMIPDIAEDWQLWRNLQMHSRGMRCYREVPYLAHQRILLFSFHFSEVYLGRVQTLPWAVPGGRPRRSTCHFSQPCRGMNRNLWRIQSPANLISVW